MSAPATQPPNLARTARMGRRRAWVLIGVHVAIALHIWHWKATGRTVTPVEPSEAMQTLELGTVNAGFIFFGLAILSTLILGRWMCGWGCHLVALQDLCGWMLRKVGIRPKPVRSRILVWIPVFAALYMFVFPQFARLWQGKPAPAWAMHLTTESFWATFPNLPIALLTFAICGFLIVYVLGNKGFCTYGCPYGGIFYHADRLAPGKIRVTSACNQCGHCTAVCTSNVRVHDEVREHGAVVDPGCMKCMDCVSVCPNDALYFGFGKPAVRLPVLDQPIVGGGKATRRPSRVAYDFTLVEEAGLAALFLFGFYAFRGLYEAIPFLLAIGMSAIAAFVLLHAARLAYRPNVRLQRFQLKRAGAVSGVGFAYAAFGVLLAAFMAMGATVNFHIHEGNRWIAIAQQAQGPGPLPAEAEAAARRARDHVAAASALGMLPVAEWEYKLGSIAQSLGETDEAIARFQRALTLDADRPNTRLQLANLLYAKGDLPAAAEQYAKVQASGRDLGTDWGRYAQALLAGGRTQEAAEAFRKALEAEPGVAEHAMNLGMVEAGLGRWDAAEERLRQAVEIAPNLAPAWLNLGLVQASRRMLPEAAASLRKSIRLDPVRSGAHVALARVEMERGNRGAALAAAREGLRLNPLDPATVSDYVAVVNGTDAVATELARLEGLDRQIPAMVYARSGLLRASGQAEAADRALAAARAIRPNLPAL